MSSYVTNRLSTSQIQGAHHDENSHSNFLCLECLLACLLAYLFLFGSAQGTTQGLTHAGQEFY